MPRFSRIIRRIQNFSLGMKYAIVLLIISTGLLNCDDEFSHSQVSGTFPVLPITKEARHYIPPELSAKERATLIQEISTQGLTLLNVSEQQENGENVLVLAFSIPLDPKQDFVNFVHLVDLVRGKLQGEWVQSNNFRELRFLHLVPDRKLLLTIDKELTGINGNTLNVDKQVFITTQTQAAGVSFADMGSILPIRLNQALPIIARNVSNVEVNFFQVKPENLPRLLSIWKYHPLLDIQGLQRLASIMNWVHTAQYKLNGNINTVEQFFLPLSKIIPFSFKGIFFVTLQQSGHYNTMIPTKLLMMSDLGVFAHIYQNGMNVFTQSLADGQSIKNVVLNILDDNGHVLMEDKTDGHGHVFLFQPDNARLLLAFHEGDTSLIDLKSPGVDLDHFPIREPGKKEKQFFVFVAHNLYLPGEDVFIKALLRDDNGNPIPNDPVKVYVLRPDKTVAASFSMGAQDGLYQYRYKIPTKATQGKWSFRFSINEHQEETYSIQVGKYQTDPLQLMVKPVNESPLLLDGASNLKVALYDQSGLPITTGHVFGLLSVKPEQYTFPQVPGYLFGTPSPVGSGLSPKKIEASFDSDSIVPIPIPQSWDNIKSPLRTVLRVELQGKESAFGESYQDFWPSGALVGIKPTLISKDVVDGNNKLLTVNEKRSAHFRIIYVQSDGQLLPLKGLHIRLILERRHRYWDWSNEKGWQGNIISAGSIVAEKIMDIPAGKGGEVSFDVEKGNYRLEAIHPVSGLITSIQFNMNEGNSTFSVSPPSCALSPVQIILDKHNYHIGEKVKATIKSPFPGSGLVTIESSSGLLWARRLNFSDEKTVVELPIEQNWGKRHDLYINVVVFQPGISNDQFQPRRGLGIVPLSLAEEERKLVLSLDVPDKIQAEHVAQIKIKADNSGQERQHIHAVVSVVERGGHADAGFAIPDPFSAFLGQKGYGVSLHDIYDQVISSIRLENTALSQLRDNCDNKTAESLIRVYCSSRPVQQQSQVIKLNEDGEGYVSLKLSDRDSQWLLMVQAWSGKRFGSAEKVISVFSPLKMTVKKPHFLTSGDNSQLVIDVTNVSGKSQMLTFEFRATGLIGLVGNSTQLLNIDNNQHKSLTVPVKALNGDGEGKISFTLSVPGEEKDGIDNIFRSYTIEVKPPYPVLTGHLEKIVKPGGKWQIPAPVLEGFDESRGQLLISSRPLLNGSYYSNLLRASLWHNMFDTVAQLNSLLIFGKQSDKQVNELLAKNGKQKKDIQNLVQRLLSFQKPDGSFSLWDNQGKTDDWLTVYASDALHRALMEGIDVPSDSLNLLDSVLLHYVQRGDDIVSTSNEATPSFRFAVQAYSSLVLARQKRLSVDKLVQLYNRRDDARDSLSLVQLAISLKLAGKDQYSEDVLAKGLKVVREMGDRWQQDYGSQLRDDAAVFALLSEYDLEAEHQKKLASKLYNEIDKEGQFSPIEMSALSVAGSLLFEEEEQDWRGVVTSIKGVDLVAGKHARSMNYDGDWREVGLSFDNQSQSIVYLRLDMLGYSREPAVFGGNILTLKRKFFGLDGKPIALENIRVGDSILVHLEINASTTVPDALVVESLPAGFDLDKNQLNSYLSKSGDSSHGIIASLLELTRQTKVIYQKDTDERLLAMVRVDKSRHADLLYLIRATTAGRYYLPPTQVMSVAMPQWYAYDSNILSKNIVVKGTY